ncbi:MAG: PaaI family thioesterase [Chloroflexi bacterium]|nr:PaaI family thioesterase [Chloroflexota bacterium]
MGGLRDPPRGRGALPRRRTAGARADDLLAATRRGDLVSAAAGPLFDVFGVEVEELGEGYARLAVERSRMPLRGVRNSLNGGVVASLADAAMQLCTETVLRPGERPGPTLELSVSYLSSARGDRTTAEARLLRRGGRLAVGDVEIRDASDGAINAKARVTCGIRRDGDTGTSESTGGNQ